MQVAEYYVTIRMRFWHIKKPLFQKSTSVRRDYAFVRKLMVDDGEAQGHASRIERHAGGAMAAAVALWRASLLCRGRRLQRIAPHPRPHAGTGTEQEATGAAAQEAGSLALAL